MEPEIRELEPQTAVIVRSTTTPEGIADLLHRDLPMLVGKLVGASIPVEHPPYVRYLTTGESMDVEVGIPFDGPAPEPDGFEIGGLPGGRTAVMRHAGSYEKLRESWERFGGWAEARGDKPNGPFWESYFTNPREEPDPEKIYTDLFLPLE